MVVRANMNNVVTMERPVSKFSISFLPQVFHIKPFLPKNTDVLDVGCGEGYISELLVKNNCQVTGIDYEEGSILKASKLPGTYIQINLFEFKPKKKFSYIVLFEVLEHLKDDKKALRLIYSWLKEDGKLIISVPTDMKLTRRLKVDAGHFRHYQPKNLRRLLSDSGFTIEKEKEYGSLIRKTILSYTPAYFHFLPGYIHSLPGILLWPLVRLESLIWPFKDSMVILAKKKQ